MCSLGKAKLSVRQFQKGDEERIYELLHAMDLSHGSISMSDFWVGEVGDAIVGIAQIQLEGDVHFISAVGVKDENRGCGIGRRIIEEMVSKVESDVYLFTIIPDYFEKLGFHSTQPPKGSAYRAHFDCTTCEPDKCVCMKLVTSH